MMKDDLNIAEIFYDTGELKHRYTRYLSANGSRWIRHGLFRAYHQNGKLASEGNYVDGQEDGLWRDYHGNGLLAAEGHYQNGKEVGEWKTWNDKGQVESKS
jgi:antitoxin component YwqK of YwqJK toxin-antitoxin module